MALTAVLTSALWMQTRQASYCIGTPLSNRSVKELHSMLGLFVNIVALKVAVSPDVSFRGVLDAVKQTVLSAQANNDVPFNEVVKATNSSGAVNINPIVQVLLLLVDETDTTELKSDAIKYVASFTDLTFIFFVFSPSH